MRFNKEGAAAALIAVTTLFPLQASERLDQALEGVKPNETEVTTGQETTLVEETEQKPKDSFYIGRGFTHYESTTLKALQDRGIRDRAALAVMLGNIKQESRFLPNICEGGARVSYHHCHRGGYGLIQWTTYGRYNGLGQYAYRTGGDPSSLHTQLGYLFTEYQWRSIEPTMKSAGLSISTYMNAAYRWLGWGIHGARTHYAYQYYDRLSLDK